VYRQGDPADSVFYIQSGKVKKTVISEQGKEAVVAILGTGNFVGEGCLTGQPLRLSTVSAMTECVIVRIAKADITRVIHEEPAFAELFIAHLLARNSRVEEDLIDQLFNSSDDGICHGRNRRYTLRLPGKTSLAEELVCPKNCDNRLLALLGNDGELRLAFVDVEDRIARVPL
jgi:CRP-like cAMP-binding protein